MSALIIAPWDMLVKPCPRLRQGIEAVLIGEFGFENHIGDPCNYTAESASGFRKRVRYIEAIKKFIQAVACELAPLIGVKYIQVKEVLKRTGILALLF